MTTHEAPGGHGAPGKHSVLLQSGTRMAYIDQGSDQGGDGGAGTPVLLLHGCPFSSFVWRGVITELTRQTGQTGQTGHGGGGFRCVAPDLLGLGDTETPAGADWTLPAQVRSVVELLDHLGLERVAVVGHDQGGAIAQLLAARHAERVAALVLVNAEAYDNWPSAEELPFVRATQTPVLGRVVLWAWSRRPLFRWALARGKAVHDTAVLTDDLVDGYIAANLRTAHRRAKTRRFLAAQLDPANQAHTATVVDELADRLAGEPADPVMIVWGSRDVHFSTEWAHRLHRDLPESRLEILPDAGHLVMEEQPARVAALISGFLRDNDFPHDSGSRHDDGSLRDKKATG